MTSKQTPINSGFDVAVVLDQRGQACDVAAPAHDESRRNGVYPWVVDLEHAERLWALSERLGGVTL